MVLGGLCLLIFVTNEAEAAFQFEITEITPSSQSGDPDDTLTYTIRVSNTGSENDDYNLSVTSTIPTGWNIYILPSTLSINDGTSKTATLYVEIGDRNNADAGDTVFITVSVDSQGGAGTNTEQVTAQVDQVYGNNLVVNGSATQNVDPDETVDFNIKITNDQGNGDDTLSISHTATGTDAWSFTYPGTITLSADETQEITVSVTPDIDATSGLKSVNIIATSEDGTTKASITITVRVNQLPSLNVAKVGDSAQDVEAGKRVFYSFSVTNEGNAVDDFTLEIINDTWVAAGWEASLDTTEITNLDVEQTSSLSEVLVVRSPADADADDEATIKVRVKSGADPTVWADYTSRTTVLQEYEPTLNVVGDGTKNVAPEEDVLFTFNVTNEGNGEDKIRLTIEGTNSGWASFNGPSSFTLARDSSGTTTLRVSPPKNTPKANNYDITVRATADDLTTSDTKDIYVNVDQVYEVSATVKSGESALKYADPDTSLQWNITLKNKGNGDDTFRLSLTGTKAGWGSISDQIDLGQLNTSDVALLVNIPDDAVFGDYKIYIEAVSTEDPLNATANTSVTVSVNQEYDIGLSIATDSQETDPDTTVNYTMAVENKGTGDDTFTITVSSKPTGWLVNVVPNVVTLTPGSTEDVTISIKVHKDADNIEYAVNVTAESDGDTNVVASATTLTTVNQKYEFRLTADTYWAVKPLQQITVPIDIENRGTGEDTIKLSYVSTPSIADWVINIPSQTSVAEGGSTQFDVVVTVPDGTTEAPYDIEVRGYSNDAPTNQENITITIDVAQVYEVGLIINQNQRSVDPDAMVVYDLIVQNKGTGEDIIELELDLDELPDGWLGYFNHTEVTIPAGDDYPVNLTFEVDEDADNLVFPITVTATSKDAPNDPNATASATTRTTVNQRYEFRLTTSLTYKKADPKQTFEVDVDLDNKGTGDDTIVLTANTPTNTTGWVTDIAPTVEVTEGSQETTTLSITVSDEAVEGTYTIILEAHSEDSPTMARTATLTIEVTQEYDVQLLPLTQTNIVNPGDITSFLFSLKNTGTGEDSFQITYRTIDNVTWEAIELSNTVITLPASGEQNLWLNITTKDNTPPLEPDGYLVNLTAQTTEKGYENVTDTVQAYVKVNPFNKVTINAGIKLQDMTPSKTQTTTKEYRFTVKNDGTETDTFKLELEESPYNKWFSLNTQEVTLNTKAESPEVTLTVQLPAYQDSDDVRPGDYDAVVRATSDKDDRVFKNLTFTTTILDVHELTLLTDSSSSSAAPGETANFDVRVKNEGNDVDNVTLSFTVDDNNWATFAATGTDTYGLDIQPDEEVTVRILVSLPDYGTAQGEEQNDLERTNYQVTVKSATRDGSATDTQPLTTNIDQVYGAKLVIIGDDHKNVDITADIDPETFQIRLTNQGNGQDDIQLEVPISTYADEWDVGLYTSPTGGSKITERSMAAGSTSNIYLRVQFPAGSDKADAKLYNLQVIATAEDGAGEDTQTNVTIDFREPRREIQIDVQNDPDIDDTIILQPDKTKPQSDIKNTAKFNLRVTNAGDVDDKFNAQIDGTLESGWDGDFWTKVDENTKWTLNNGDIESDQTKSIWFIVHVNPDEKTGNYTINILVTNDGEKVDETVQLTVEIQAPTRGLKVTPDGNVKEELTEPFNPEYKPSSASKNDVKFQLRLENTGSHVDKFIPEVTLNKRDWTVEFYKTGSKSGKWDAAGEDIEESDVMDLWVYVTVDDEADAREEYVEITIRNEDRDAAATQVRRLYIDVQRSDLSIESTDITLEVDGDEVGADQVKDGDSIAVYLEVHNLNTDEESDASNVYVEIFYYDKNLGKEDEANLIFLHQGDIGTVDAGASKKIKASSEWSILEGEWKLEARVDYDESDPLGEIKETDENNNAAIYPSLLQVKPDLNITLIKPDLLYQSRDPNIDDTITFTATIYNSGSADATGARLYGFSDNQDNENLKHQGNSKYVSFNVDALSTATVRFKWKPLPGEYSSFWFETNPICGDVKSFDSSCIGDENAGDRMIDELGRTANNMYPTDQQLDWEVGNKQGQPVQWTILPDFIITAFDFSDDLIIDDKVKVTITVANNGTADWAPGTGTLKIKLSDDATDYEETLTITKTLDAGDEEDFEFDMQYKVPDETKVKISAKLDAGKGSLKIEQISDKNDDLDYEFKPKPKSSLGGDVTGNPLILVVGGLLVLMFIMVPLAFKKGKSSAPEAPEGPREAPKGDSAAGGAGAAAAGAPAKISVMIQSPDGKVAKPKMLPTMPVKKLLEICVQKFELGDGSFQLLADGKPLDVAQTLSEAGVKEGDKIVVAAEGAAPPAAAPAIPPAAPPVAPPQA